jgi:hypothetical protein
MEARGDERILTALAGTGGAVGGGAGGAILALVGALLGGELVGRALLALGINAAGREQARPTTQYECYRCILIPPHTSEGRSGSRKHDHYWTHGQCLQPSGVLPWPGGQVGSASRKASDNIG